MLPFQQRAHLLIASILSVPGDEFHGAVGNSRDQIFPGGEFHVALDFLLVTEIAGFDPQSQFLSLAS